MASKRAALGKGLSALLPSHDEDGQEPDETPVDPSGSTLHRLEKRARLVGRVADVPVSAVEPNPYQPRTDFNDAALDELADSIKQLGVVQPITVRTRGDDRFELISGERRVRAARRAGLSHIPAYVREADAEEMLEMAIVENVQREELNPVEIALGYQRLIDECGLTQAEVAERVGKGRATVTNFLRLLKLPARLQAALRDGDLSVGHARALITVEENEDQLALLKEIIKKDLSVRQVEARVRALQKEEAPEDETLPDDLPNTTEVNAETLQIRALTDRLRSELSTRVQIRHKPDGKGTIEIDYYSNQDLERLSELLLS